MDIKVFDPKVDLKPYTRYHAIGKKWETEWNENLFSDCHLQKEMGCLS